MTPATALGLVFAGAWLFSGGFILGLAIGIKGKKKIEPASYFRARDRALAIRVEEIARVAPGEADSFVVVYREIGKSDEARAMDSESFFREFEELSA